ncbi:MAG TPA: hypothetical protein VNO79_00825 [Actinomycetota bacterium]|nr:hypothetical protein [Actinomycetota bacterium]
MSEEFVHARYVGTTVVVVPDLAHRGRCCRAENLRPDDPTARPNPKTVLEPGDVILLDRHSAEGRADFEVLEEPKPTRRRTVPADEPEA